MTDNATGADNQQERLLTIEQRKWYLAGFIEGDGSICVSVKEHPTAKFGYFIQPALFIYQHQDRRELLDIATEVFQAGSIWPKPGNTTVLVYGLFDRIRLMKVIMPFYEKYMIYSRDTEDFRLFKQIVQALIHKQHLQQDGMLEIVDMVYRMNISAKSKGRKRPQSEIVKRILRDYTPDPDLLSGKI